MTRNVAGQRSRPRPFVSWFCHRTPQGDGRQGGGGDRTRGAAGRGAGCDRARRLRRRLVPRRAGTAGPFVAGRGLDERRGGGGRALPDREPADPPPADRGVVPPAPRDRRRADRGPADRARVAPHRLDGALVPAGRGSRRPVATRLGGEAALPAARDGRGPRSPDRPSRGGGRPPGQARSASGRPPAVDGDGARGVPGPHGPRLQGPLLPGLRLHPVVLTLAARRRPHIDLPLRAAGAEAAPVGSSGEAVAAEVPDAPPVPRPPRPRPSPTPAS